MPSAAWVSILVTLALAVLAHVIATVWWASRIDTMVGFLREHLKELIDELKATKGVYATKEEVAMKLSVFERDQKTMWLRIDELKASTMEGA